MSDMRIFSQSFNNSVDDRDYWRWLLGELRRLFPNTPHPNRTTKRAQRAVLRRVQQEFHNCSAEEIEHGSADEINMIGLGAIAYLEEKLAPPPDQSPADWVSIDGGTDLTARQAAHYRLYADPDVARKAGFGEVPKGALSRSARQRAGEPRRSLRPAVAPLGLVVAQEPLERRLIARQGRARASRAPPTAAGDSNDDPDHDDDNAGAKIIRAFFMRGGQR